MSAKRIIRFSLSGLIVMWIVFGVSLLALAVHDLDLFELDGNAIDDIEIVGDDWSTLYGGEGHAEAFTGILPDTALPGTQFTGGGSKDISPISDWLWKDGEPLDKDDITDAYAAAYTYDGAEVCPPGVSSGDPSCTEAGDLIVYFGLDRFAVNGSAQVGFWFLQDPAFGLTDTKEKGGYLFSGEHMNNDVLVQSNFSNGGVISRITVYKWVDGALVEVYNAADCADADPGDLACAIVNKAPTDSPWPYTPKSGTADIFPTSAFFEGGINISNLIPNVGCFTGFIAETRSSTPFTSQLKDFVTGSFDLCKLGVDKSGDTLSKVGDPVDYTVTITNTGALPLYKDTITDTVLGDITKAGTDQENLYVVSNTCGVSLAPGAHCDIMLSRDVESGDTDPLPNTVTATYRGFADLTGIAVSSSDDHEVNLFQPSIELQKVGDELSKIGDTVDYTITLTNTSSSDTPDLTCTVTDTITGVNESFTIAAGEDPYIIQVNDFAIPNNATDPFVNTAYALCSPAGFPNIIPAQDSWSTNLFQPSIELSKVGDELSKKGDSVDYTITLTNTSSSDTPDLTCTVTDTITGVDESFTIAAGEDPYVIQVNDFTIPNSAADPFVNTAYALCSPAGFPNVIPAQDSWSTNLFQPSIELSKVGDELSKKGDSVDYTITLTNTSSSDTPDLACTVTDTITGVNESFTIAAGDDPYVIQVNDFTIPNSAADPFVNTAYALCSPAGFPNVIPAQDSWSTNLFQPKVALDKECDELSKVGDTIHCDVTITNQSSSDSPNLVLDSFADSLVPGAIVPSACDALAPGAHCDILYDYTVKQGDPDPLVNKATAYYHPFGYTNVISDTSTWDTNLFQPSVEIIKSGPDTAGVGETITYGFTINNLSSADSPDLILDSVSDDVIGNLYTQAMSGGCGDLAPSGTCSFTADYTTKATDPNPLVNTVTVNYHPDGFPNVVTDNDSHSVSFPTNLGCTPGFWQGGAGSLLWDGVNDPAWVPFTHDTLFNSFFTPAASLNNLTMYDLVSSGGGSDWVHKAARDLVAAYLNESAFPIGYPASSTAALKTMWTNALAGGDAGLQAFHEIVSAWNAPQYPGYCPLP